MGIRFNDKCKACEQKERNERTNEDRPLAITRRRAAAWANRLGVSFDFMWVRMNWQALVPMLRVMMTPEGLCLSCGHHYINERDIQIEHRAPPRFDQDWARQHARNIGLLCTSCNVAKNDSSYTDWLDEQEHARISNDGSGDGGSTPLLPF